MTEPLTPPGCDLDAIKAQGLNCDAYSRAILSQHEYQRRIELHHELLSMLVGDNGGAHPVDVDLRERIAVLEAGL